MIKIILSIVKIIVTAIVALLFASCGIDIKSIEGSGRVTTENRNIAEDFHSVSAESGLEIVIEQADQKAVIVEADDNLHEHITTKVENGVLHIGSDYNNFRNVKSRKVTIKMPVIKSLQVSSGASLVSENILRSNQLTVDCSSGSSAKVQLEADAVISESSSGSNIELSGKALRLDISASSGSVNNAKKLYANDVTAQASSGSSIDVHPIVSLDAKASSGASVDFYNSPPNIKKDASSGGSVSPE